MEFKFNLLGGMVVCLWCFSLGDSISCSFVLLRGSPYWLAGLLLFWFFSFIGFMSLFVFLDFWMGLVSCRCFGLSDVFSLVIAGVVGLRSCLPVFPSGLGSVELFASIPWSIYSRKINNFLLLRKKF